MSRYPKNKRTKLEMEAGRSDIEKKQTIANKQTKNKNSNTMQNKSVGKTPESNSCLFFQSLNIKTAIKAANGQSVEAKTVFARSIRFLKEEALKVICQRTGDNHYNANDIQWVLTVPAIWTPKAKQFMREAAYEVRMDKCEALFKY